MRRKGHCFFQYCKLYFVHTYTYGLVAFREMKTDPTVRRKAPELARSRRKVRGERRAALARRRRTSNP